MTEDTTIPAPPEPLYEHDCDACTFLGSYEYEEEMWDLYFCRQASEDGHELSTVGGRRSSNPHDYTSGLALADYDPILREARERAKERGLLPLG